MAAGDLDYRTLLDLYRGRATVVELIDDRVAAALRVDTPLLRFLAAAATRDEPRHIFLTGNAGDGKTFAARTALPAGAPFVVIADGSEQGVDELAQILDGHLTAGRRLLVAINRGQLERLRGLELSVPLRELLDQVAHQLLLRVEWEHSDECPTALAIDLGLIDTLADQIIDPILDKVAGADPSAGELSATSRCVFESALEALRDETVRGRLKLTLRQLRSDGQHVTMRQLWSWAALLATGGRDPLDTTPLSLADTVGARAFAGPPVQPLPGLERLSIDPALTPQPELALDALAGRLDGKLAALPGLSTELISRGTLEGALTLRVAWVHGLIDTETVSAHPYDQLIQNPAALDGRFPQHFTRQFLQKIYEKLGLWSTGQQFPGWQRCCYDSWRIDEAAWAANRDADPAALRLAFPGPHPAALEALQHAWRPPYLQLSMEIDGAERNKLRLRPQLVQALWASTGEASELRETEQITLRRWLSRLTQAAPSAETHVRIYAPAFERPLLFNDDLLMGKTAARWEG